ncbi:MAG: RNA methyltransferase [Selenomonadaceae bacterium]|nr:RNA methyltransferase [Selenomonadaceae bacterium]
MSTAKLKIAQKLKLKKYRDELKLFVAEGLRLCEMASEIEFGFYTADFLKNERAARLVEKIKTCATLYEIPAASFEKISDTKTPQGIILICRQKIFTVEEILQKKLIVALDAVSDAGNLGTILRTAEAFNCGVVILENSADIFNSKVVRASMGAIFNLPVVKMTRADFLLTMQNSGVEILAAALDSTAEIYYNHNFKNKSAVVFGSEATGVSTEILNSAKKIYIPMTGRAESLNVATAAAIIISEFFRQN